MGENQDLASITWDELGYESGYIPEGWRCEWPAEHLLPEERPKLRFDGVMSQQLYLRHLEVEDLWERFVDSKEKAVAQCIDRLPPYIKECPQRETNYFVGDITESPVRSQYLLIDASGPVHAAYLIRALGECEDEQELPLKISASFNNLPDHITMAWDPKAYSQVQEILSGLGATSILQTVVDELGDRRPRIGERHEITVSLSITQCIREKHSLRPRRHLAVRDPMLWLPIGERGGFQLNAAGTLSRNHHGEKSYGRATMPEFLALGNSILGLLDVPSPYELTKISDEKSRLLTGRNRNIPLERAVK